MRSLVALATAVFIVACEGPTGPEGVQGSPGSNGVANRVTITVAADASGHAFTPLPPAAGASAANLPALTCYRSSSPFDGTWYLISDGTPPGGSTPYCYVEFAAGQWHAAALNIGVGRSAAFVVTY
jgi:hypothetical protein